MEVKETRNGSVVLLEIQNQGQPVSPKNPVTREMLKPFVESIEVEGGELALLSGMPQWAMSALVANVKNLFGAIAIFDPRIVDGGGCVVIHSTTSKYEVGQIVPLP